MRFHHGRGESLGEGLCPKARPFRKGRMRGSGAPGSRESPEWSQGHAGGASGQVNPKGVRGMQEAREVVGDGNRRRGANPQGRNVPEVATPGDTGTRHEAPKGKEPQERQAFDLAVDARQLQPRFPHGNRGWRPKRSRERGPAAVGSAGMRQRMAGAGFEEQGNTKREAPPIPQWVATTGREDPGGLPATAGETGEGRTDGGPIDPPPNLCT